MAKMTKQAAKLLGEQAANASPVDFMTLDAVEAADYLSLRDTVQAIAREQATRVTQPEEATRWFDDAFVERLMSRLMAPVKARETARRNWKRALEGVTPEQAIATLRELVVSMHLRPSRIDGYGDSLRVDLERTFTVGADIGVRFRRDYGEGVRNPDNDQQRAGVYTPEVTVSWSSAGSRSVSDATACVAVYRQAVDAAAELQAVADRMRVIWTWGLEEAAPAVQPQEA